MNETIKDFVITFETKFKPFLIDPNTLNEYSKLESFPGSSFFKFKYDKWPSHKLSDWDLACWLAEEKVSRNDLQIIHKFIKDDKYFSDVGLFSKPQGDSQHLQYMAYTPNEPFAPFLDLHLRCPLSADKYTVAYWGDDVEHKRWSLITGWRKVLRGDIEGTFGARRFYRDFIKTYWENEEDLFINDPKSFCEEHYPNLNPPSILLE
jgi:hypothetical protein